MAYLNEDGLETLVGKIKGQVIELTSAEYRQLPATKNTDNKLYFVTDEAYAYQIDDEPTSGSSGLVKSGGVYNWTSKIGSGTLTTTAQTLIPAVNEVNAKIGSTDISTIGDGTLTGAVDALNAGLTVEDITSDFSPQSHIVTFYAFKCGKRISICFQGDTHESSTDISIVTIPSQYRPTTVRWYGSSIGLSNKPRTSYISSDYVVHSVSSETTGWYAGTLEWYMQ